MGMIRRTQRTGLLTRITESYTEITWVCCSGEVGECQPSIGLGAVLGIVPVEEEKALAATEL